MAKADREGCVPARERSRRYRNNQRAAGNCVTCGRPANGAKHCEDHKKKEAERNLRFYHEKGLKEKTRPANRIRHAKKKYGGMWELQVLLLCINDEIRKQENG